VGPDCKKIVSGISFNCLHNPLHNKSKSFCFHSPLENKDRGRLDGEEERRVKFSLNSWFFVLLWW
jgi:hypothetical protein